MAFIKPLYKINKRNTTIRTFISNTLSQDILEVIGLYQVGNMHSMTVRRVVKKGSLRSKDFADMVMLKGVGFTGFMIEYQATKAQVRLDHDGQFKKPSPGQIKYNANRRTIEEKLKFLNHNRDFEREESKEGTTLLKKGNVTVFSGYELESIDALYISATGNLEGISKDLKVAINAFSEINGK